jgi:DNA gyrase subunit A
MFITNMGRLYWLKGYKIPEGSRQAKGKPIVNMIPGLDEGEKVINTVTVSEFTDDRYLVFCTRNGTIKKTSLSSYGNVRNKGIKAIKLDEGDEIIETGISDGKEEIVIATRDGQAARFSEEEVRPTGRDTMGVRGVTLVDGDVAVGMTIVKSDDMILTVSENGFGKISVVDDYRKTHRGSKGVITIKTTERNGSVVAIKKVELTDELMVTSKQGKVIRIKVSDIRVTGRNAAGVKIMDMRNDDKIIALQPLAQTDDDTDENEVPEQN